MHDRLDEPLDIVFDRDVAVHGDHSCSMRLPDVFCERLECIAGGREIEESEVEPILGKAERYGTAYAHCGSGDDGNALLRSTVHECKERGRGAVSSRWDNASVAEGCTVHCEVPMVSRAPTGLSIGLQSLVHTPVGTVVMNRVHLAACSSDSCRGLE